MRTLKFQHRSARNSAILSATIHLCDRRFTLKNVLHRQAHIDELIPYNNQELYDRNVRNFSQSYAYALLHGSLLRQLRGNHSNASLKNQQQPNHHLNDQNNKFNLRLLNKRKRRSAMTLGLRIVLSKEHFQVRSLFLLENASRPYSDFLIDFLKLFN